MTEDAKKYRCNQCPVCGGTGIDYYPLEKCWKCLFCKYEWIDKRIDDGRYCNKKYECPKCGSEDINHVYVEKNEYFPLSCSTYAYSGKGCRIGEEHFHHRCQWCHYGWTELLKGCDKNAKED